MKVTVTVCRGETNTCTCCEDLWETGDPGNGFLKKEIVSQGSSGK